MKFQQVKISNQQVVWHLVDFKMIWKSFVFALVVKQFQQVEISNQKVFWHLVDFKMIWKSFVFAFSITQKSIDYFDKLIDCFSENLNKILLSGFSVLNDSNNFWFFVVTVLTIWLEDKKVFLRSYALKKWERSIKNNIQVFKELLDHLKCGIGLGLVFWTLILWFMQVYYIPFFLDNCIFVPVLPISVVCSWRDKDQHS